MIAGVAMGLDFGHLISRASRKSMVANHVAEAICNPIAIG